MANPEHLDILKQGVETWNQWRQEHRNILPDLNGASFHDTDLSKANLSRTNLRDDDLSRATLRRALISEADLRDANLSSANLNRADLGYSNLSRAILCEANLSGAFLLDADLSNTDLSKANLIRTIFIGVNLTNATLTGCQIYGISAWDVQLEGTTQNNLVITPPDEPTITVDNLKLAQFIYLLLNNAEIREVIDTITSKVVLILGRFTPERKAVLDALREELRNQNYSPVVFNIEETDDRDFTATVRALANMAHFVLIDLTDLNQTTREIADAIVPHCVVPIRPLLLQGSPLQEYQLFRQLEHKHRWVLPPYRYKDLPDLQSGFQEKILQPIDEKILELQQKKPLKMFIGYAPEDKNLLKILKNHLRPFERAGVIGLWDDQDVAPGEEQGEEIERHLSEARIILLLLSPAFLASHDCYDIQMSMALERYEQAEASVIPILLRPCAWKSTPLKDLQPLPKDGKPISRHNKDEVFFEVSEEIAEVIKSLG